MLNRPRMHDDRRSEHRLSGDGVLQKDADIHRPGTKRSWGSEHGQQAVVPPLGESHRASICPGNVIGDA